MKIVKFFVLGLCVFACSNWASNDELPILAATWIDESGQEIEYQAPRFELIDQENQSFSHAQLKGKVHVLDFFFTSCTSICPRMTQHMKIIQDHFQGNEALVLLSFSIDPATDKPSRLHQYAQNFGISYDQWKLLRGRQEEIRALSKEYKVRAFEENLDGQRNLLHDGTFLLLDEQARVRGYYDGLDENTPQQLIKDIEKLLKQ